MDRLRSDAALHARVRDLTIAFSRGFSSSAGLGAALTTLADDVNQLFGARRAAIWLYERQVQELVLSADSDAPRPPSAVRVPSDDGGSPPSQGLRLERPRVVPAPADCQLLVPLRGWRRALGTMVIDGPFGGGLDETRLTGVALELGRQLSAALETIQLLDEIHRQRRLLEDTFDSFADLVVVTDPALRIVHMNEAFAGRVGLSRAELLGRSLDGLVGDAMAAWIVAAHLADTGAERTRQVEDSRLGGTFAVTITPLAGEGKVSAGHVLVARDVTRETRLEREREAMRERLAQAEKLASLGQFVAGVAHEMNNPLQAVLGHLELLIERSEAARPLRRDLRRVFREAGRAAKIVRNLMMFAGSRRLNRRPIRLPRLVSRALASRDAALRRAGITVTRDEPPDLPRIHGDPLLLHQVLLNILINAEHALLAAGGEGRIDVRARADASNRVILSVGDNGPGIPPDVLPRVFDPFFTTKHVGEGTGLGLALAYGIVQDHGGVIHAANAPEGGAVLTVELPACVEPAGGPV